MRKIIELCLCLAITVTLGCSSGNGGGGGSVTPPQDFIDNMPNGDTAVLDENAGDKSVANLAPIIADPTGQDAEALTGLACHPHLFWRTRDAVRAINRYVIAKFFRRLDAVIDNHATKATSSAVTWTKPVDNGAMELRITLTKSSPGHYTLEVDAKAPTTAPDSAYVVIQTATVNNTAGTAHQGNGTMHLDLNALGNVLSSEKARGTIDLNYTVNGNNKLVQVTLTGFTGDDTNPHQPPANANFVFARTAGVGGSFKYVQQTIFACPEVAGPDGGLVANTTLQANLKATHRWKVTPGGDGGSTTVVGRSDGQATGGNIPNGQTWVGVTCSDESATTGTVASELTAEKYWQMALFTGTGDPSNGGANLVRGEYDSNGFGVNTCDSSFGTQPSGSPNYYSNYTFTTINFNDASAVPFPGEPSTFP